MKNIINLSPLLLLLLLFSCKKEFHSEYDNLPYRGGKNITINRLAFDTIRIDASATSLAGQWLISNDTFYFADEYSVGVSTFDLNGNAVGKHIEKGRGPQEALSNFVAFTFSPERDLVGIDATWNFYRFDTQYQRKEQPYLMHSEVKYDEDDWNELLRKPDPEVNYMYEFNTQTKKIRATDEKVMVPILTEHIHFNGYNLNDHARDFWRESYIFQFFDIKHGKDLQKFGHYPPIYYQKNMPMFADYNFDLFGDKIYTTFMADSLIYVRDPEGKLIYSFGCSADIDTKNLPETKTFNEHEQLRSERLAHYGYYTDLLVASDYVLRGYKKEGKNSYGIQIYKDNQLVGDIPMGTSFQFIGKNRDQYYLLLPTDLDNELFEIHKFSLP